MRFTLSSTALSSKLVALSRVINSKNALPILGDFLFEIDNNVLYLTASDSENVMKTQMEFRALPPAKALIRAGPKERAGLTEVPVKAMPRR